MKIDLYTRVVLTVIAVALVYLCVVLTPLPGVSAQSAPRPGMATGASEVVIVGWRASEKERVPVQVIDSPPVKITGDVSLSHPLRMTATISR